MRLVDLAKNWDGPISAAMSISNISTDIHIVLDAWLNTPEMRRNVDVHLMFDDKVNASRYNFFLLI